MPKLGPAPHIAHQRSVSFGVTVMASASGVTTFKACRLSTPRPFRPMRLPRPPPKIAPSVPTQLQVPVGIKALFAAAAGTTSEIKAPPWRAA